jgi:hypothetical protein
MTNNVESVPENETLGSALAPIVSLLAEACDVCMDSMVECDKCSNEFCVDCEGSPGGLPVAYCHQCLGDLDPKDPLMNFPLLRLLNGEKHEKLIVEFGVEAFVELTTLA